MLSFEIFFCKIIENITSDEGLDQNILTLIRY